MRSGVVYTAEQRGQMAGVYQVVPGPSGTVFLA